MKILGLTGGIGSGKSTVANIFKDLGIQIYNSDYWAKRLMIEDDNLKNQIIKLLGKESYYENGSLNKKYIAEKIFSDNELLEKQNSLVHPAVAKHFEEWKNTQKGKFCIKEAAILFESGAYKSCDLIAVVISDDKIRIKRVMKRDNSSREEILKRMNNQWKQEELIKNADFIIDNNSDLENLEKQVKNTILLIN